MRAELLTSIRQISDLQELSALEPAWAALWADAGATVFQSPHWLLPWYRHIAGGQVLAVTMGDEERMDGVALFHLWLDPETGKQTLLLAGTGLSDYLDVVVRPGFEQEFARELQAWVARGSWDRYDFQNLPETSCLRFESAIVQQVCPVLDLHAGSIPAGIKKRYRYAVRRAQREADGTVYPVESGDVVSCMESLFALHSERWQDRGQPGVLAEASLQRFHLEVAQRLSRAGALRLYALKLNGEVAGVWYGFAHRGTTSFYLSGYNLAWSQLSPGMLLAGKAIEGAINEGADRFDFLRGAESYKYTWGATDSLTYRQAGNPADL